MSSRTRKKPTTWTTIRLPCRTTDGTLLRRTAAFHRSSSGARRVLFNTRQIHPFRLPERGPEIPYAADSARHRLDRELFAPDPAIHLLPRQRRRDAGPVTRPRAVGGRQRLAE